MAGKLSQWVMLLVLALGVTAGCGKSGGSKVMTVRVSGAVYLDDKPLQGALVVFVSEKHTGIGKTDAKGKYTLEQGAAPGQNKVVFSKTADQQSKDATEPAMAMPRVDPGKDTPATVRGEQLPEKYSNGLKPSVTFDVPEKGTRTADFRLTSR